MIEHKLDNALVGMKDAMLQRRLDASDPCDYEAECLLLERVASVFAACGYAYKGAELCSWLADDCANWQEATSNVQRRKNFQVIITRLHRLRNTYNDLMRDHWADQEEAAQFEQLKRLGRI